MTTWRSQVSKAGQKNDNSIPSNVARFTNYCNKSTYLIPLVNKKYF